MGGAVLATEPVHRRAPSTIQEEDFVFLAVDSESFELPEVLGDSGAGDRGAGGGMHSAQGAGSQQGTIVALPSPSASTSTSTSTSLHYDSGGTTLHHGSNEGGGQAIQAGGHTGGAQAAPGHTGGRQVSMAEPQGAAAAAAAALAYGGIMEGGPVAHRFILRRPYRSIEREYGLEDREALGTGQYGVIRSCVHRRSGMSLACKTISKGSFQVCPTVLFCTSQF